MKKSIYTLAFSLITTLAMAQEMPLYPNGVPNTTHAPNTENRSTDANGAERIMEVSIPTITAYLAPANNNTGTAVIICPGGGYRLLSSTKEGSDVAKEFNKMGISAFVLKYRIPSDKAQPNKTIAPLQDAQEAIRMVRKEAKKYGINPNRIGIMGFSAGGHLASTALTHLKPVVGTSDTTSVRPDFGMLIYPVITMKDFTHQGSKDNLLGKNPSQEAIDLYSNENQVSTQTPPVILVHAGDDKAVPVKNSLVFYEACLNNNVSAQLLIYPKGGHGFGLNNKTTPDKWMDSVKNWIDSLGFLKK